MSLERLAELTKQLGQVPTKEEDFRLPIIEEAPDGIIIIDETGAILAANKRVVEMFGYSRSELVSQRVGIFVPEAQRTAHDEHLRRWFRTPEKRSMGIKLDIKGQRKDGTVMPLEISIAPLESSKIFGMAFIRETREPRV